MVAIATISPNIASPEGEGFAPSPEETLKIQGGVLLDKFRGLPTTTTIFSRLEPGKIKWVQSCSGLRLSEDPAYSSGTPLCPGFEKSILDVCPNRRDQAGAASWIGS